MTKHTFGELNQDEVTEPKLSVAEQYANEKRVAGKRRVRRLRDNKERDSFPAIRIPIRALGAVDLDDIDLSRVKKLEDLPEDMLL